MDFSHSQNFTGFRGSFITVQIGSTFSRSAIHTRFSKEVDDQNKLARSDSAADFAAYIALDAFALYDASQTNRSHSEDVSAALAATI